MPEPREIHSKVQLQPHTGESSSPPESSSLFGKIIARLGLSRQPVVKEKAKPEEMPTAERVEELSREPSKKNTRKKKEQVVITDRASIKRLAEVVGEQLVRNLIVDSEILGCFKPVLELPELKANEETREALLKVSRNLQPLVDAGKPREKINQLRRKIKDRLERLQAPPEEMEQAMEGLPEAQMERQRQEAVRFAQGEPPVNGNIPENIRPLIEQARRARRRHNIGEMEEVDKVIRNKINTLAPPRELIPGSQMYMQAVDEIVDQYKALEQERDAMAQEMANILAGEMPRRLGRERSFGDISDLPAFVKKLQGVDPGRLAGYFVEYPEMAEQLKRVENRRYLHQLFLQIMQPVLQESETPTHESLDLYRRADLVTFTNLVRSIETLHTERNKKLGLILADHYIHLKNTLMHSHDLDYWAAHPQVEVRQFVQSLALYRNEYLDILKKNPLVTVAYRAYEEAILAIRETHGGYIPPGLIAEGHWDDLARDIFLKMIKQGVVYEPETDEYGLPVVEDGVVKLKRRPINWRREHWEDRDLEIAEALKLGKGFGVANFQLIRHFAYSRGPGADHLEFGMPGFHSLARYEGIAKYMNPMAHIFSKFRVGDWRFWHFFNQLLPEPIEATKLKQMIEQLVNEPNLDEKIYQIAREGRWDKVYGKEGRQRIMDMINLTNTSNFGPWSGLWRILDATIGWNERDREKLGGTLNLMLSRRWAFSYVREMLAANGGLHLVDRDGEIVLGGYRLKFAQKLAAQGKMRIGRKNGYHVPEREADRKEFERQWLPRGQGRFPQHGAYETEIEKEWKKISDKKKDQYIKALTYAYKIKTAIQMADRNPLFVARNIKVPSHREGGPRMISLRDVIIEEIFGYEVDLDITTTRTPTKKQIEYMKDIVDLEGDVMTIREYLMRADEGRGKGYADYTEEQFEEMVRNLIYERGVRRPEHRARQRQRDKLRQDRVIKYFKLVNQALLGNRNAKQWLEALGLQWRTDSQGRPVLLYHDFNKILGLTAKRDSENTFKQVIRDAQMAVRFENVGRTLNQLVISQIPEMDLRWSIDFTDAMWEYPDWLNLGTTQPSRGGGDLASHAGAIDLMGQYIQGLSWQFGDKEMDTLVEMLDKIQKTVTGDDVSWGWHNAGLFAYLTMRLYKQYDLYSKTGVAGMFIDWFTASSYMQKLVPRFGASGANANELYKFIHKIGIKGVLPPTREMRLPRGEEFTMTGPWTSVEELEEIVGASRDDRIIEILVTLLTLAPILTIALAAFQSATKKEEEEG